MKKTIGLLAVLILVMFSYEMAVAAPSASSVTVVNTTTNPVPVSVTNTSRTTQVVLSSDFTLSNAADTNIDVSMCSQIRITASVNRGSTNQSQLILLDESTPNLYVQLLHVNLSEIAGTSYFSQVIDTPGTALTLTPLVYSPDTVSVRVYCR